jgi:hypothetical protein
VNFVLFVRYGVLDTAHCEAGVKGDDSGGVALAAELLSILQSTLRVPHEIAVATAPSRSRLRKHYRAATVRERSLIS